MRDIRNAVEKVGATVEEDCGFRDMRVIQLVAPMGKLWAGTDCQSEPIHWACGSSVHAVACNETAFSYILDTLSHGLRDMTIAERDDYEQ